MGVEQHKALVKMVVLHRGGGVERGQGVTGFDLKAVVGPTMVQVMTQAGND